MLNLFIMPLSGKPEWVCPEGLGRQGDLGRWPIIPAPTIRTVPTRTTTSQTTTSDCAFVIVGCTFCSVSMNLFWSVKDPVYFFLLLSSSSLACSSDVAAVAAASPPALKVDTFD